MKFQKSETKAFAVHRKDHNGVALTFPNGNWISSVWGTSTYCENYDKNKNKIDCYGLKILDGSNDCEIMIDCPDKLKAKIHKKYDFDGSIKGYVDMKTWLEIVNLLAK